MASKLLKDKLNEAIAREMQVSIQYMWQHIVVKGMNAQSVGPVFRLTAIAEMLHAELIAERLDYLGGKPTTQPSPINVGGSARDMLKIYRSTFRISIRLAVWK